MSSPASSPLTGGCLALFGLPFFAGGALMLVRAMDGPARHAEPGSDLAIELIGAVFVLVGGGMIAAAVRATRAGKRELERRAEFPEQPWRWRDGWLDGVIAPTRRRSATLRWVLAVIWCGVSAAAAFGLWATPRGAEAPLLLRVVFGIGFPLGGLAMIGAAVHRSLQVARFGRPSLHLVTVPGSIGGWLHARVECALPPIEDEPFTVRVRCIRRVTSSGPGKRRTEDLTVWSSEQVVAGRPADEFVGGSLVDVVQALPAEGSSSDDQVRWEVDVACDRPGLDFHETWEIPVFEVPGSDQPPPAPPRSTRQPAPPRPPRRVRIVEDGAGVTVRFPAALNPGLAGISLIVAALGVVATVAAWQSGWRVGAGLIALPTALIAQAALRAWLQTTVVHARRDGVEIVAGVLGLPLSRHSVSRERIDAVRLHTDLTADGIAYRRAEIAGRRLGSRVRGESPAEAVRHALARGLGQET